MREVFISRENDLKKYRAIKYLDGYLRIANFFAVLSLYICLTVWFLPIFNYFAFGRLKPALDYWFPFDISEGHALAVALLWMDFAAYFCSMFQLATDMLLYALITTISMEFDFLKLDFMNLALQPKKDRNTKFIILIDRHNKLLAVSEKLQNVYGPIFLLAFFITSIIECLLLFQLSTSQSDISVAAFSIPFFVRNAWSNFAIYFAYMDKN